jgi:deferrochelatase/peroxidase EfeB
MVGRWPEGAPLVLSGEEIDPTPSTENNFGYWKEDPEGMKCPYGAHIRRSNPRDFLLTERSQSTNLKLNEKRKEVSIEMIRKHQIIRRGRSFGKPLDPTMEPEKLMTANDDGVFRGLHFICLAGHISRQFEFILNAWSKSPTFSGLYNDADPMGAKQASDHLDNEFTCPAIPARRKYRNMPQFTQLVGGAYFFLPGIKALQYIIKTP